MGERNPVLFHDDGSYSLEMIFFFPDGVPGGLDGRGFFHMVATGLERGPSNASVWVVQMCSLSRGINSRLRAMNLSAEICSCVELASIGCLVLASLKTRRLVFFLFTLVTLLMTTLPAGSTGWVFCCLRSLMDCGNSRELWRVVSVPV